jgi:DNA-binding transcriptional ArsR family regulator
MRNHTATRSGSAAFHAIADPTRRAVLDLLRQGSLPAGHIARAFPITRPAVSKHLGILRRAKLVRGHRTGRNLMYELNPEPLKAVDAWLDHYRSFWQSSLTRLKSMVESDVASETPNRRTKK